MKIFIINYSFSQLNLCLKDLKHFSVENCVFTELFLEESVGRELFIPLFQGLLFFGVKTIQLKNFSK